MGRLSFEKDDDGRYQVAYFDGDATGPVPPFTTNDPQSRWCLFNGQNLAGLGTMLFEEGFDTLDEVKDHFRQNEKVYRAAVPTGTPGP